MIHLKESSKKKYIIVYLMEALFECSDLKMIETLGMITFFH